VSASTTDILMRATNIETNSRMLAIVRAIAKPKATPLMPRRPHHREAGAAVRDAEAQNRAVCRNCEKRRSKSRTELLRVHLFATVTAIPLVAIAKVTLKPLWGLYVVASAHIIESIAHGLLGHGTVTA
jgi:hypothetical protein